MSEVHFQNNLRMNLNSYGPPVSQQQQHLQQSQQPMHQYLTTWPPAQQQQAQVEPNGAPTVSSMANMQPTSSQEVVNGNYQQQLVPSMRGLSVNPTKQCSSANIMPMSVSHHQGTALSNGPPSRNPQLGESFVNAPPSSRSNNIDSVVPESYGKDQLPVPPVQSQTIAEQLKVQQKQSQDGMSILSPPPPLSQNLLPPLPSASLQSIPVGVNQINIKSADVHGLPHMPAAKAIISSYINSTSDHSASLPGAQNQSGNMMPPQGGVKNPAVPEQKQFSVDGGFSAAYPSIQQQMSTVPNQSSTLGQQTTDNKQPMMASAHDQSRFSGDIPVSGQESMPEQHTVLGQSSMSGQSLISGQSPMSVRSPMSGQSSVSGQSPMSDQSPISGQTSMAYQSPLPNKSPIPSMPGQPPMPGPFSMRGQLHIPGQPQVADQLSIPGSSLQRQQPIQPPMQGLPPFHTPVPTQQQRSNQQSTMVQSLPMSQSSMCGQQPSLPVQQPLMPVNTPTIGQQPPILGQAPLPDQNRPLPGQSQMRGLPTMPAQPPTPMPGYHQQQQHSSGYSGSATAGYTGPMMPPQPGQPSHRPGYNQLPGEVYQQQYQSAQRRLDPDQMPNPIQVMIENQRNSGGLFVTNQPGLLPPLVTTKFVVQDQGNSSPRFVRSSLYCIPASADLLKTTALPFTLIISPLARIVKGEYEPPIVDFGELGPIRCNRCKAYMSPNMQFIDAGRRFQCLMCKVSTEVPTEYFQHLDHTGQRMDKYERPELVLGTYEFLATRDYCRNNTWPEIPALIFVIDVSYNTIKSGLVHLLCSQVKRILKNLPVDQGQERSKMRVGFITYSSTVHFYNIKSTLAQPQMMVVGDVHDIFMPLLDGFLCHPEESETVIDALMEQIPKMFVDTKETETVLYPAIQAGCEALKASNCAGKLLVFNSSLPTADAPGKLKNRDDRKLLGTEKEKTVLMPQCTAYNTLGQDCVQVGCSVDLFLFNNSYIDIATIGQVARLTGGEVYKYTYFQADTDGKRLIEDIIKNISRPIAFDSVMRVRTSAGIRPTDFFGHYFMTNTTDVELASIDANKSIAIEIKHDDKLPPEENVYLQIALLYTSCGGQRRLRIFNLSLRATTTISDVFKSCDLDAIMLFLAKQACFKLMELTPKTIKDNLINRTAQALACYRKHCTSPTSAGQLILPECLKLLPLYISCLIKNDSVSGGSDMTLDDRSYVIQFLLSIDLNTSVNYLYPRLIPIHNVNPDEKDLPMPIRCTHEKITEDGAYILENGVHLFIWLGQSLPQSFIQPLFGVQCTQQVNAERFVIAGETPLANRIRNILEMIMTERTRYMRVTCVRQNDKLESVFRHFLIEDRGTDGSASYVDFLCHMHKEIKELLS